MAYLYLYMLVPQGYSASFVSILSGESKELITVMKGRGYSGEKASGFISIRIVLACDHLIPFDPVGLPLAWILLGPTTYHKSLLVLIV